MATPPPRFAPESPRPRPLEEALPRAEALRGGIVVKRISEGVRVRLRLQLLGLQVVDRVQEANRAIRGLYGTLPDLSEESEDPGK